uniref:protein-serine/threonine phosphatase n=1 Tax=Kalanchoe fedtschenkoi TaxID=63787 RepID=A0A7N0TGE7_KALFE
MGRFSDMFNGMAKSLSIKKRKTENECVEALLKDAKRTGKLLRSSGVVNVDGSQNFASLFSRRGEKGANQDRLVAWEEFGCQEDMMFCGVFDGHGEWGHLVAKKARDSMPASLLCRWQDTLAHTSIDSDFDLDSDRKLHAFNVWKQSFIETCAAVDQELALQQNFDSCYSGSTALSVVRQGDMLIVANIGDSRAVLGSRSEDGSLVAVQLTVDFKPNITQEAERITRCNGRVFCLEDEPGVYRVWLPHEESPGLAMSRALGDYCVKGHGLISVPDVRQWPISSKDQFVILATDGVWDVVSNQEAVEIVSSAPDKAKSARRLADCAARAWKRTRRGYAADDISAICLFFHSSPSSHEAKSQGNSSPHKLAL